MKKNTISNAIKYCLSLSLLISLATNAAAQIYVKHDATGANDGTSWANAYTDLQTAINAQSASTEIWVATGTYYPTQEFDTDGNGGSDTREQTFYINKSNLPIYGGFAGTETLRTQRNMGNNPTILSGDIGVSGVNTDNAYHVVTFDGNSANVSSTTILDGFTITKGYSSTDGTINSQGGGILFIANSAGKTCSPTIDNCKIIENQAVNGGGTCRYATNGSSSTFFKNCLFANNIATASGGAIYHDLSSTTSSFVAFSNCTFTKNTAGSQGSVIYTNGTNHASTMFIANSILWDNTGNEMIYKVNTIYLSISHSIYGDDGIDDGIANGSSGITVSLSIDLDPKFTDAANGDFTLLSSSPGLNIGRNASNSQTIDADGNPRLYNSGTIDLGPYEYQGDYVEDCPFTTAIYVNAAATGNNDGTSWADAYTNLQKAISSHCGNKEIWVAAGTYYPTAEILVSSNDLSRSKTFVITKDGAKIYGGFVGNETAFSQRNPTANVTILSGDLGTLNDNSDNAFHVVTFDGSTTYGFITTTTVLDGVTIQKGNANGTLEHTYGGGIYIAGRLSSSCSPTISNCVIDDNTAVFGGGMFLNTQHSGTCNPVILNCQLSNNIATGQGGAVYSFGESSGTANPSFTNCLFYSNQSTGSGGAIGITGSSGSSASTITNCTFSNNTATGGGIVFNYGASCNTTIVNTIIWSNTGVSILNSAGASSTFNNGIYDDGTADNTITLASSTTGNNNQDQNPYFADIAANDYSLKQSSIAIDNGDATSGSSVNTQTTDLAGNPRFYNTSKIDVGAYEFQGAFVLPVELIYFKGENQGDANHLTWQTASEQNNHGFEIERSIRR